MPDKLSNVLCFVSKKKYYFIVCPGDENFLIN